jgi:hypothetical protein
MDLVEEFPVVKLIVKQIVFLVKSVRKTHLIQQLFDKICKEKYGVATPLWPSVGVKPNTSKVGDLESSGTPECLELNSKA